MTDRELLELAAKAAGIDVNFDATQWDRFWVNGGGGFWNPLTDDGDALRLAVKLRLHVDHHSDCVTVWVMTNYSNPPKAYREHDNGDPLAATRRAIVRAAAEIGRQIK